MDATAKASATPGVSKEEAKVENKLKRPLSKAEDKNEQAKKRRKEEEEELDPEELDRQRIRHLLTLFTPEQMRRYEHFRRSHFNRKKVKKIIQSVSSLPVSDEMSIAMGGVAKIFAGELIETARLIMEKNNLEGPIRPSQVLSAYAELKRSNPEVLPPGANGLRKGRLLRR
mmetsp:Transcript_9576/g.10909  ORF Transcript_9576/g.10909 Transcript_9576/m.10909 type:complete len:171 (+) Transcript_9576:153-665(+)